MHMDLISSIYQSIKRSGIRMLPGGFFNAEAHAEASDRLQAATEDLRDIHARRNQMQQQMTQADLGKLPQTVIINTQNAAKSHNSCPDDDEFDEEDSEWMQLREKRLEALKKAQEEKQILLAKGHGEFREITQDEFLREVTSSDFVLVHFYHKDFERCKIMDMHLRKLAPKFVKCKFLKLNAEKAPFFVEKLQIRILPTVVGFDNGVALSERLIGLDGLQVEINVEGSGRKVDADQISTRKLAMRLAQIGVLEQSKVEELEDAL